MQLGAPIGFFFANGTFLLLSWLLTDQQFMEWGWRVPLARRGVFRSQQRRAAPFPSEAKSLTEARQRQQHRWRASVRDLASEGNGAARRCWLRKTPRRASAPCTAPSRSTMPMLS
jgi:hypothetical protein